MVENKIFHAMNRYRNLYEKFPLSVQKLLVEKYGDRYKFMSTYTEDQIYEICDRMEKALKLEEQRLYDLYKDVF